MPPANRMKFGIGADNKHRSRRDLIHPDVDIVVEHQAGGLVLETAINRPFVFLVLFPELVNALGCAVVLVAAGNPRHPHQHPALVERRLLLARLIRISGPPSSVAIPIGNVIRDGRRRMMRATGSLRRTGPPTSAMIAECSGPPSWQEFKMTIPVRRNVKRVRGGLSNFMSGGKLDQQNPREC